MSMNKVIVVFLIILLVFGGYILYQFATGNTPKSKVTIGKQTFSVKVATTSAQQQQGLSGIKSLPKDQGMLFLFSKPDRYAFWMKEMQFPLDIIFITKDNTIDSIAHDVKAPSGKNSDLPIYQPDHPVTKALEINAGLAKQYDFKPHDKVKIELDKELQKSL